MSYYLAETNWKTRYVDERYRSTYHATLCLITIWAIRNTLPPPRDDPKSGLSGVSLSTKVSHALSIFLSNFLCWCSFGTVSVKLMWLLLPCSTFFGANSPRKLLLLFGGLRWRCSRWSRCTKVQTRYVDAAICLASTSACHHPLFLCLISCCGFRSFFRGAPFFPRAGYRFVFQSAAIPRFSLLFRCRCLEVDGWRQSLSTIQI